jgi:CRISPR/Cas system Type II protein with McrA/HNH and RuvC-like nuclease domain
VIINTRKNWNCYICGRWMKEHDRQRHVAQHKKARRLAQIERGEQPRKSTERGKYKARAKKELQAVTNCAYCGRFGTADRGPDGLFWNMDHIIPWSVAQIESLENYVKSCHTCNMAKGNQIIYPEGSVRTGAGILFRHTKIYKNQANPGCSPNRGA